MNEAKKPPLSDKSASEAAVPRWRRWLREGGPARRAIAWTYLIGAPLAFLGAMAVWGGDQIHWDPLAWLLIAVFLGLSAIFSGINVSMGQLSPDRLETLAAEGNRGAQRLLALRGEKNRNQNWNNSTVLLGNNLVNIGIPVLLTTLVGGLWAFGFSLLFILNFGEILAQSVFQRHAETLLPRLAIFFHGVRTALAPVGWLYGRVLDDAGLQQQDPAFSDLETASFVRRQAADPRSDVDRRRARLAVNSLGLDDKTIGEAGEPLDEHSVMELRYEDGVIHLPAFERTIDDPFLRRISRSKHNIVVLTSHETKLPVAVLDVDAFITEALFAEEDIEFDPARHIDDDLIVTEDPDAPLHLLLSGFFIEADSPEDHRVDNDIAVLWSADPEERRFVDSRRMLGYLGRGVIRRRKTERIPQVAVGEGVGTRRSEGADGSATESRQPSE